MGQGTGTALGVSLALLWLIGIVAYFIPTIVAGLRHHRQALPIFALNLLLGWTFLGWVAALVWSLITPSAAAPGTTHPVLPGTRSPDGQWVWDGRTWVAAAPGGPPTPAAMVSPDGRWVWDGQRWVAAPDPPRLS